MTVTIQNNVSLVTAVFDSRADAGAIEVDGVKAGDVLLSLHYREPASAAHSASLAGAGVIAAVVTHDDFVDQLDAHELGGASYVATFLRAGGEQAAGGNGDGDHPSDLAFMKLEEQVQKQEEAIDALVHRVAELTDMVTAPADEPDASPPKDEPSADQGADKATGDNPHED